MAELLVGIATLGVMITVAGVGLGTLSPQMNLDNGTRTLVMALTQARVQAITRGHAIDLTFGRSEGGRPSVTVTDPDGDPADELLLHYELSTQVTVSADPGVVTFSPIGTVDGGLTVTVSNSHHSRSIIVGLSGEAQVQ